MKQFSFKLPVVEVSLEENGPVIHRSPDFSDISALSEAGEYGGLAGRMEAALEGMSERDLYRKNLPREFVAGSVQLKLQAAREFVEDSSCWVTFHYVCWKLPRSTSRVAYVPAFNIKVIIEGAGDPGGWVRPAIERALAREGWAQDLYQLLQLGRMGPPRLGTTEVKFNLLTAAEKRQIEAQRAERMASVLGDFVDNLQPTDRFPCHGREDALLLAVQSLAARQPRGVLLIGPSGVGKTALVHELARQKQSLGLSGFSIWATTGGRIVAGMAGFGEWQLRCVRMAKQATRQRAIIYLGSLRELCQSGRSEHQNQSVAEALIEPIQKGGLTVIVEATEEELALIEKDFPQVVQLFDPVRLLPPSGDALSAMLAAAEKGFSEAAKLQRLHNAVISLHRRYGAYAASLGREMRFLQLLRESNNNRHPDAGDAIAFFQQQSGMPDFLLEADKPFAAEQAQDWFAQRVRGHGALFPLTFSPAIQCKRFSGECQLRRRTIRFDFPVLGFSALGTDMTLIPHLDNLLLPVSRTSRNGEDLLDALTKYFRKIEKESPHALSANPLFLGENTSVHYLEVDVPLTQTYLPELEEIGLDLLGVSTVGNGRAELAKNGTSLSDRYPRGLARAYHRDKEARQLLQLLQHSNRKPLLIVGMRKAGKSALFEEAVFQFMQQRQEEQRHAYRRGFWKVHTNRMMAGMSHVGDWQKRLMAIAEHAEFEDHTLFFDPTAAAANPFLQGRDRRCGESGGFLKKRLAPATIISEHKFTFECQALCQPVKS